MKNSKKISISIIIVIISVFSWFSLNILRVGAVASVKTPVKKTVSANELAVIDNQVIASKTLVTSKPVVASKSVVASKPVAKKVVAATNVKMKWTADGLKALGSPASFGYNYTLRNTIIKKIENYARKKKITVITAKVVNNMNE